MFRHFKLSSHHSNSLPSFLVQYETMPQCVNPKCQSTIDGPVCDICGWSIPGAVSAPIFLPQQPAATARPQQRPSRTPVVQQPAAKQQQRPSRTPVVQQPAAKQQQRPSRTPSVQQQLQQQVQQLQQQLTQLQMQQQPVVVARAQQRPSRTPAVQQQLQQQLQQLQQQMNQLQSQQQAPKPMCGTCGVRHRSSPCYYAGIARCGSCGLAFHQDITCSSTGMKHQLVVVQQAPKQVVIAPTPAQPHVHFAGFARHPLTGQMGRLLNVPVSALQQTFPQQPVVLHSNVPFGATPLVGMNLSSNGGIGTIPVPQGQVRFVVQ